MFTHKGSTIAIANTTNSILICMGQEIKHGYGKHWTRQKAGAGKLVFTRSNQKSEAQESASKAGVGKHLVIAKHRAERQESTTNIEQAEYVSSTTTKE